MQRFKRMEGDESDIAQEAYKIWDTFHSSPLINRYFEADSSNEIASELFSDDVDELHQKLKDEVRNLLINLTTATIRFLRKYRK